MTKSFTHFSLIAITILFLVTGNLSAQSSQKWQSKVSTSLLSKLSANAPAEFIVIMKEQADVSAVKNIHGKDAKGQFVFETLHSLAENSQHDLIQELQNEEASYQAFWVVNAIRVKGNVSLVEKLAARNDVEKIINNTSLSYVKPVSTKPAYDRDIFIPWGVDSIHAPAVWAMGYEGQGVVVGGEDTGYDWEHPAIKNQYRGWNGTTADHNYNWHDAIHAPDPHNAYPNPCGIDITAPCDDYGHGTHTMGTMVGQDGELEIGIAPQAKWIGERNMEQGWGNLASYMEAFEWFIAPTDLNNQNPDPSKAPDVINNSWVCVTDEGCDASNFSMLEDVVNNVTAAGIVVVASAGNDGPWCSTIMYPPAIFESTFSTGAVDSTMNIAWFSSRGNVTVDASDIMKPNVAAPGVDVFSSIPGDQYAFYSGTSMAGPHTVGTVALMISANPLLAGEVDVIENIIEETAHPVTTSDGCGGDENASVPNNTYGYGIIDALAAVQQALVVTSSEIYDNDARVEVFPTLTNDLLHVNFSSGMHAGTLYLYSVLGQYFGSMKLPALNNVVHLSNLPAGIYLYRVEVNSSKDESNGEVVSGKVVKQ